MTHCKQSIAHTAVDTNNVHKRDTSGEEHVQNFDSFGASPANPCLNIFNPGEDIVIVDVVHEQSHCISTFHRREVSQLRFVRGPTTATTNLTPSGIFFAFAAGTYPH